MFEEEKHPRDGDGKFAEKDGDKKSGYNSKDDLNDIRNAKENTRSKATKSKEEFFGEEFKGYTGQRAIEKLLKEKRGHIKAAFERPEIGSIDLVWGDEKGGVLHTIIRRDKMQDRGTGRISGIDMVKKIPDIVENGEFNIDERERPGFNYDGYRVAIRPTFDGEKLNWIVSAMEKFT